MTVTLDYILLNMTLKTISLSMNLLIKVKKVLQSRAENCGELSNYLL